MYKEKWKELGYTDEQSEELERLSKIGNDMGDIDAHVADKILRKTMQKYERENKKMSNKANLGKSLTESLEEACGKFSKWMESSNVILDAFNAVKASVKTVEELDSAMVEVTKVTDKTAKELSEELEESFSDLEKNSIVSVDTFEIDLKEKGIDVSEWEEPIKPVKAIMSVVIRKGDGEYGLSITMGNMVLLMEDGTFRMN